MKGSCESIEAKGRLPRFIIRAIQKLRHTTRREGGGGRRRM